LEFPFPIWMKRRVHLLLARNITCHRSWRSSVIGWMWASKHLHIWLPRDVALMIARMIR